VAVLFDKKQRSGKKAGTKTAAGGLVRCAALQDADQATHIPYRETTKEDAMQGWAVVENGKPLKEIEVPMPEPAGTQVLLRVTHCGVCHSDLYFQDGHYDLGGGKQLSLAARGVKLPLIPGHEVVGEVVAIGPDAQGVALGQQSIVFPWAGCGNCNRCRAGDEQLCAAPRSLGIMRHGGYGSHVLVDRPEHLVAFGDIDPALAATYACSGLTAYSAVHKLMPLPPGEAVVLMGAGGLGLAAISILHAFGCGKVVVVDVSEEKLALARAAGAMAAVNGRGDNLADALRAAAGGPVAGVIDFVGSSETAQAGIEVLSKGGSYIPVGLYGGEITLALPLIPLRAISIRGSYTGNLAELKALVELAQSGALTPMHVECMAHSAPNMALDRLRRGDAAGRLVLEAGRAP
jgi:alcohol dehydrogenase/propanol-preferring alcohol dehydrogenase